MLKEIRLYGELGRKFGRVHWFDVATAAEAVKAMRHQIKGFATYLREHLKDDFAVIVGKESQDEEGLYGPVGSAEVIKILPVVSGASNGLRVVAGAVLVVVGAVASYFGFGAVGVPMMKMGAALIIGGVAGMLATVPKPPTPSTDGGKDPTDYIFGSPRVTVGQGYPVPIGYGRMRVGGAVLSSGIASEAYLSKGFGSIAPDDNGTIGGNGSSVPWAWAVAPEAI